MAEHLDFFLFCFVFKLWQSLEMTELFLVPFIQPIRGGLQLLISKRKC